MYSELLNDTRKKPLHIRVIVGDELRWEYVCDVPRQIFAEFLNKTGTKMREFGAYLDYWGKIDFQLNFWKYHMANAVDLYKLKKVIITYYKHKYLELYNLEIYNILPKEDLFVSLWVTQHMIDEVREIERKEALKRKPKKKKSKLNNRRKKSCRKS